MDSPDVPRPVPASHSASKPPASVTNLLALAFVAVAGFAAATRLLAALDMTASFRPGERLALAVLCGALTAAISWRGILLLSTRQASRRGLVAAALLGMALILFLWPLLTGQGIPWLPTPYAVKRHAELGFVSPGYAFAAILVVLFAAALLPLLVPAQALRTEHRRFFDTLGRVATVMLCLPATLQVIWFVLSPIID